MDRNKLKRLVEAGRSIEVFERPFNGGAVFDIDTLRAGKQKIKETASNEITPDSWAFEARDESGDKWVALVCESTLKLFWTNRNGSLAGGHHSVPYDQIQPADNRSRVV